MLQIPLQAVPNQTLSTQAGGNLYDLTIRSCRDNGAEGTGIMVADIAINGSVIITGSRATSGLPFYETNAQGQQLIFTGFPLIPFPYLENGNFIILTQNYEYPNWRFFNVTQYLIYASQSEIEGIINAVAA